MGFSRGIWRPPARVEGPCRAAESASSTPHRQDVGPVALQTRDRVGGHARPGGEQPPGAAQSSGSGAPVWARDHEPCAAWKLTHPGAAGELAGPEVQCLATCTAGAGGQDGAPEGTIRGSTGGIWRPPARVEGPCRAAESVSSAPHRQDVGPGGAAAAGGGAVELVRGPVWAQQVPQSRPYPRGGSTLSSAPRSSAQIASSLSPSAVSWSASGRLSSHP